MNEIDILEQRAVDAAININWPDAIITNKKILKLDKNNLGALLRLGFIHLQNSEHKEAKKYYKAALKIQPSNILAQENLEKIKILEVGGPKKAAVKELNFNPNLFLDVPGRTRSVPLINPGQKNILAAMTIGEEVHLKPKKRKIEVRTTDGEYLGSLPDDLSKRLLLFIKAGSEYSSFIKDVSLSRITIFVREDKKGKRVAKYTSFPKNSQTQLAQLSGHGGNEEDHHEVEADEVIESDLDQLAEILTHEDKEFMTYHRSEEEDEENIEE